MNYNLTEAISLHRVVELSLSLERVNPAESEHTVAFKRRVLSILRDHAFTAADLSKVTVGDGVWTVLQYLRGNPEMPWNVLLVLRDWQSRYLSTGDDYIARWSEVQDFQGC